MLTPKWRGVSLYVSDISTATPIVLCDKFCESVCVSMPLTGSDKLLIGCIYRSPSQQCDLNNARLWNMLLIASNMKDVSHVLIMGDFNLSLINWTSWICSNNSENSFDNIFINCHRDSFFHQLVTIPKRSRCDQNPSILDLMPTNDEGMTSSLSHLSPLGKSDHSILTFNFHCYMQHRRHYRIQYNYKKETTLPWVHNWALTGTTFLTANVFVTNGWYSPTMSILHRSTVSLLRPIQPRRIQGMTLDLITKPSSR